MKTEILERLKTFVYERPRYDRGGDFNLMERLHIRCELLFSDLKAIVETHVTLVRVFQEVLNTSSGCRCMTAEHLEARKQAVRFLNDEPVHPNEAIRAERDDLKSKLNAVLKMFPQQRGPLPGMEFLAACERADRAEFALLDLEKKVRALSRNLAFQNLEKAVTEYVQQIQEAVR